MALKCSVKMKLEPEALYDQPSCIKVSFYVTCPFGCSYGLASESVSSDSSHSCSYDDSKDRNWIIDFNYPSGEITKVVPYDDYVSEREDYSADEYMEEFIKELKLANVTSNTSFQDLCNKIKKKYGAK
jgi:hypothetical protein